MNISIADLRQEYMLQGLSKADVDPNPFQQFQKWFDRALASELPIANAMMLATATKEGKPSARVVLLKGVDPQLGFVFYTNYESQKGQDLAQNPQAALVFWWAELERQVRIEGNVEKISAQASDCYFQSRPSGSQLGAWVSQQSRPIQNRDVLEQRLQELEVEYRDRTIPRPPHWGGYALKPITIEFWQGRTNRLHDRLRYYRLDQGGWQIERLAP